MRALVAGHLCIDLEPGLDRLPGLDPGALYTIGAMGARLGGCVHTTGTTLAGLGVDVLLAAALGADPLAVVLLDLLAAEGLDASRFERTAGSTSYSIVVQAPGRDRTFWHHAGANDAFDGSDLDVTGVDLLHVGYPNLLAALCRDDGAPLVELFSRARAAGCATSLDLAVVDASDPRRGDGWARLLQRVLPLTDVVTPSIDDLATALAWDLPPGAVGRAVAAEQLLAWGAAVVLVTAGNAGLQVATGTADRLADTGALAGLLTGHADVRHVEPAVPVAAEQVVSTTGAGDVATGGFLAGLLRGWGPVRAAALAASVAARHVAGRRAADEPPASSAAADSPTADSATHAADADPAAAARAQTEPLERDPS